MSKKLIIDFGGGSFFDDGFRGALATAPENPKDGWEYINISDNYLYRWAGEQWWQLYAVTPTGAVTYRMLFEDGDTMLFEDGDTMRFE